MENVAFLNADLKTRGKIFPNLALLKLASWHRRKGDSVSWYVEGQHFDKVYVSKVFTFTKSPDLPENAILGGTGFGDYGALPDEIEHACPDYAFGGVDFSLGFLTRGCPNACGWCIVPRKEGQIRGHADIEEFARHRNVILMDNNVLASDFGIDQIEKMGRLGLRVDFNQGLDARRIDESIAKRLSKLRWMKPLRLACDTKAQIPHIQKAVKLLREAKVTPRAYFCYVLVKDIEDAHERVMFLRSIGVDAFAQPYRDFSTNKEPTWMQKQYARWVNHKALHKSVSWEKYIDGRMESIFGMV